MKTFLNTLLAVALMVPVFSVQAEPTIIHAQIAKKGSAYAISGILRSNSDRDVIRLLQAVHVAVSKDEAVGAFTREALAQYPGYAIVDTLVMPVPAQRSACTQSI